MDIVSTLLIAVALAMDAFSVSLTPTIGYLAGMQLEWLISTFAPWVAFILLALIGTNMIRESFSDDDEESDKFSFKELTLLAIATSIDAFAVGVTYAVLKEEVLIPIIIIGVVAFIFTLIGIYLGKKIGDYFGDKFEILGGVVLILLGIRILLNGLGIINF